MRRRRYDTIFRFIVNNYNLRFNTPLAVVFCRVSKQVHDKPEGTLVKFVKKKRNLYARRRTLPPYKKGNADIHPSIQKPGVTHPREKCGT